MSFLKNLGPRTLTIAAVLAVLVASIVLLRGGDEKRTVSAHFPRAVSIFENTDVRVLGVTIGKVTAVRPEGESVRVDMEYDAEYKLPADAKAVIVTPTLVADRFVQLTPAFETGDKLMADGADIPLASTGVPVELDRIYSSLRDLSQTLGPNGVNSDGTLNHLMTVAAKNLEGKGALGNQMIKDLSEAAETFGQGSGDLFQTVNSLAEFTGTLAANDQLVRAFLQDLAGVSADLAGERQELAAVLTEVAAAVGTVRTFIRDNKDALVTDVEKLTRVVGTIASEKESLNKALRAGPVGIGNLNSAFDVGTGSIGSRIGMAGNFADLDGFLCSMVQQSQLARATKDLACSVFKTLIEPIGSGIYDNMSGPGPQGPSTATEQARFTGSGTTSLSDLTGGR